MTGRTKLTIDLIYDIAEKLEIDPASLLPERTDSEPKISFEEYIRRIIKDEFEKLKKEEK